MKHSGRLPAAAKPAQVTGFRAANSGQLLSAVVLFLLSKWLTPLYDIRDSR